MIVFLCDRVPITNSLVHLWETLAFCSMQAPWGGVQSSCVWLHPQHLADSRSLLGIAQVSAWQEGGDRA